MPSHANPHCPAASASSAQGPKSASATQSPTSPPPSASQPSPSEPPFISTLRAAFPDLRFRAGSRFRFHPPRTIFYDPAAPYFELQTLHELGHATIPAQSYRTDVERLKIERAAWDQAQQFCAQFHIAYDSDFVESLLDTYRDWLHARSRCPHCGLTRYQSPAGSYHCPQCDPH